MMSSNSTEPSVADALASQWANPGDILSLLLIVGGDVVQKAVAQLTAITSPPFLPNGRRLCFTPIAFSFGWVAFAFSTLMSALGEQRLMPVQTEFPSILVNCGNAFVRDNMSWVLSRMLRDHKLRYEVEPTIYALRVDIFDLKSCDEEPRPHVDHVWWSGCITILIQIFGFGIVGWVKWDDWGTMLIALGGTLLALITASMPQWADEKWSGRRLRKAKVVALTRGNGSHHVMVIRGGSRDWDLETLAAGVPKVRRETKFLVFGITVLWTCLLISISGLKTHTWLLVGMGGLGMVQNLYAAGAPRSSASQNIHLTLADNGTIIGQRQAQKDDAVRYSDSDEGDIEEVDDRLKPKIGQILQGDVMDVLIELENRVQGAGVGLLNVFYPGGISYKGEMFRKGEAGNRDKRVFKALYRRNGFPVKKKEA